MEIKAKSILGRASSPAWFGLDYNMNLYRGCCHGCIYCDSRSDCYHIENFDQVRVKADALKILRDELRRKIRSGVVGTGSMSDPYNPLEQELQLTRHALELLDAYEFGVAIATKGTLILRDMEILQSIQEHSPVLCKITITTAEDSLSRKVEPFAPAPSQRFEAIAKLTDKGIFAGILLMPVLPFLEDREENIRKILSLAREAGAQFIYPAFGVTLRQNQREWYFQKLEEAFPGEGLAEKYRRKYGDRYQCTSPRAEKLRRVLEEGCGQAGILTKMQDIIRAYRLGYGERQLKFFD